jgi:hypothetical protein
MKKLLLTAVLGGLFAATTVQAQVVNIYIAGSTAFRANAYRVIKAMYDQGAGTPQVNAQGKGTGASLMTFSGTMNSLYGSQTVNIYCDWTGSAQGVHTITATPGDTLNYLLNATPDGDTNLFTHVGADLAFSDAFQATTGFNTPTLQDEQVAVQPFCWVRSPNTSTSITNVTIQQLRFALGGSCPLTYLTGSTNAADYSTIVYFTGRSKDSGSRLIALSDALYTGSVNMYSNILGTPVKMTVNQIVNGVNYGPGFTSGGTEAGVIAATPGFNYIGYLGYADARTVVAAGGAILSYDGGLPFAGGSTTTTNGMDWPNFAPVTSGQYSMWGPEHLFINPAGANYATTYPMYTNIVGFFNADITNLANGFVTAIPVSAMGNTTRTSDGGKISP